MALERTPAMPFCLACVAMTAEEAGNFMRNRLEQMRGTTAP